MMTTVVAMTDREVKVIVAQGLQTILTDVEAARASRRIRCAA